MAADGVPVDIGALNEAGCSQIGDGLNKATLLKDATAALYGLAGTAVPDEVLAKIKTIIDAANASIQKKVASGYYTGNGNETRTIPLPFTPKGVLVMRQGYDVHKYNSGVDAFFGGLAVTGRSVGSEALPPASLEVTTNGFIVRNGSSQSAGGAHSRQTNQLNFKYNYIAIG